MEESVSSASRVVIGTVAGMQRYANGTVFTLEQVEDLFGKKLADTSVVVFHTGEPAVTVGGRYVMLDGLGVRYQDGEKVYSPYTIFSVEADGVRIHNQTPYWLQNDWVRSAGTAVATMESIRRLL